MKDYIIVHDFYAKQKGTPKTVKIPIKDIFEYYDRDDYTNIVYKGADGHYDNVSTYEYSDEIADMIGEAKYGKKKWESMGRQEDLIEDDDEDEDDL